MLSALVAEGVPIDGVGFQSHTKTAGVTRSQWNNFINFATRVAQLKGPHVPGGLKVYITELDVWTTSSSTSTFEQQADTYAEYLERFLALPNRGDFTLWGFTDKHTWVDGRLGTKSYPLPFDVDYNEKPAYDALQRVLRTGTARTQHRDPFARIDAEDHDAQRGAQTYGTYVSHFHPGDFIKFAKVDFDAGAVSALDINYAVPNADAGNTIELRLDSPTTGPVIGTHRMTGTGGWTSYQTRSVERYPARLRRADAVPRRSRRRRTSGAGELAPVQGRCAPAGAPGRRLRSVGPARGPELRRPGADGEGFVQRGLLPGVPTEVRRRRSERRRRRDAPPLCGRPPERRGGRRGPLERQRRVGGRRR